MGLGRATEFAKGKGIMRVSFVSYDGEYPVACMGKLVLKVDGKEVVFPAYCIESLDEWYIVEWPKDFPEDLKDRATDVVNKNIDPGCCGGCT